MGCYLVCHFSGLWAFLMSTLIPLRSGAGVYVTLEEEEDEAEKTKHISFLAGDLCTAVSQAGSPLPPHQSLTGADNRPRFGLRGT